MFYASVTLKAKNFSLRPLINAFHCKYNLLHFGLTLGQRYSREIIGTFFNVSVWSSLEY